MKLHIHEHRNAGKIIDAKTQDEVKAAITNATSLKKATPARDAVLGTLRNKHGWSDEVKISADAKISITSHKGDVGLCFQTGNMGRFYADLLKLEFLFKKGRIHAAFYILPDKALSKVWGENIANYERFVNEVTIFSQILNTPLLIIGISK
jgi:hypothetical protein